MHLFQQWWFYVILYLILAVIFNQVYKVATAKIKRAGALTVILQVLAGITALAFMPLFHLDFPTTPTVYVLLTVACCFYAVSDRMTTTVRSLTEASTFSVIKQLSTAFLIVGGFAFMGESFTVNKIIGAAMIIGSNILLFYNPKTFSFDRGFVLGVISQLIFTVAMFIDVNISGQFNIPLYVAFTLIVPSLLICLFERIGLKQIAAEFKGNKRPILITALTWGPMIIVMLVAYNLGEVSVVAPIAALTTILNVVVGYIFLKERSHLLKKIIAATTIVAAVLLINLR
jgi:transporter family protein